MFHSRKYLLYHNDNLWIKKDTSVEFDVTLSSYGGVDVCKIVRLFTLDMLSKLFEKNYIGLHRDNVCQFSEIITVIRTIKLEKFS